VKTASASVVAPGGSVTYRYEVRNTGNIPLADVANRISDDRCAPVTYVSGDDDGNGLLTPDLSRPGVKFFEYSAAPEVWVFTCTTTVSADTVNTVTVGGVPSDTDGNQLGDPVSASATATVTVAEVSAGTAVAGEGGGTLPFTGGAVRDLLLAGLLAVAGGIAAVVTRRRGRGVRAARTHDQL
jgi:hypothetical protein